MELPPSGWYPDPYGVPGLLRWWDGSRWTQHTHTTGGADAPDGAGAPAGAQQTTVQPAVQQTTVQPTVPRNTVQPTTVQPTTVQPTKGRHAAQPTTVQPAVLPNSLESTTVQPTTVQPTTVQPAAMQGQDVNGTQVLFLGDDAWTTPGGLSSLGGLGGHGGPGGPGGSGQGDMYGYYRARRRRRMWLTGGLAGGTAVALGLIALVVSSLGNSRPAPLPTHTAVKPPASSPPASPTPSPTSSSTPSSSVFTDGSSGLSYTLLGTQWQPTCPSGLNSQFNWTGGESAIAGQINGGQTTWYGEACSGPLPTQQYGYNGVADLENTATNLANNFNGAYYSALNHNYQVTLSQPITVSGHPGWEVKYQMTYPDAQAEGLPFTDEQGAVVVADSGAGLPPAVFFVSIPSNLNESNVDSLVSSLQLTQPAQPGGGGSPGAGSPAAGSPAPGGGGDGNGNGHHHSH